MARLNEPSAAIDSLDALKRRFIRQNREIARVNSTQSVRIRNLEGDVSRLLSENLALRERIITLHHEVEKKPGRAMLDGISAVKGRLEAKLTELGELVQELGVVTTARERRRSSKRRSMDCSSPRRSPDQRTWRNGLGCSGFAGGLEGRLPPILEDKYFPRKTLDTEELLGLFSDQANVTDSPDLGPPPVGHFEDGEPGALDQPRELDREDESTQRNLFANLDTRRRRRETSSIVQTKTHEVKDPQPLAPDMALAKTTIPVEPLKPVAKRPMTAREVECNTAPGKGSHGDDIISDYRHVMSDSNKTVPAKSNNAKAEQHSSRPKLFREPSENGNPGKARDAKSVTETKNRKALGSKSTNTDPTSPIKLSKTSANEKFSGEKEKIPIKLQGRSRVKDKPLNKLDNPSKEQITLNTVTLETKAENNNVVLPPSNEISAPGSPEPHVVRQASRNTSPPSNLQMDTVDTGDFGTAGRSTRRPRGSVSYAEPNLRAKMRRPTSDLIDAVTTVERAQSLTASRLKEFNPDDESAEVIRKESEKDPENAWKIGALDGIHNQEQEGIDRPKDHFQESPATIILEMPTGGIADRRRRTVGFKQRADERLEPEKPPLHPGASSAIAALMAGSQRPIRREEEKETKDVPRETQDIYNLNASSPTDALETDIAGNGNITTGVSKNDSMSKYTLAPSRRKERKRDTLGVQGAKRDGTTTTLELKTSRSVAAGFGQQQQQQQQGEEVLPNSRAERLAVRRRSMMI